MAILSTSTLTFIDLNEISIGDEPNNPTNNQIWFDTSTNTVKKWNSLTTSWEVVNDYTEDIKDAIRNLNISGRNLLANTAYSKELSGTGGTNQTGCKYNLVNTITYEKDIKEKEITLAFDWEFTGSIAAGSFIAQTAGPLYTPLSEVINISSNNYYGTSVFTTILTDTKSFSAVEIKASGVNGIIRVTHPRLFYGSKDLDWSPAPEDTAAQFETIFDRTAKGIYMSVSDLEANKKSLVDINNNAVIIKSDSINLEGLVTANNNFKVLLDGSIEAVNGKFSGIIQADTEITSPKISGGTINGTSLTVGDNFSVDGTTGKLTAKDGSFHGTIEADSDIQGATFTSKNGYFKVLADGTIESTGGKFTGNVTSNLAISGATITGSTIETESKKFKVDNNGILTATEAKISGTITSSEISSTTIKAGNNNEFLVSTDGSVSASNLTISGGSINLGNNTFKVDNTGKVTASNVSITGGTLSIGDKFLVSNTGVLTAIDGNFKGNIQADSTITGASFASKNNTLTIDADGNLVSEGTISLAHGNFYVNDQGQLSLTGSINAGSSITGATITGGTIGTKNGNFYVNSDGILTAKGAVIEGDVRITSGSVPSNVLPDDIVSGAADGTSANEKIDNLQIGGRNLWVISDLTNGHETTGNITTNTNTCHQIRKTLIPTNGTKYITYQLWNPNGIINSSNTNRLAFYDSSKTYISSSGLPKLDGNYQTGLYDIPTNASYVRLAAICGNSSYDDSILIKFEFGNKPTGWTPAPEDIDNKFTNYSTTEQMNSAITQKAGEITSSVSSTYATKSTVNSLSDNLAKNYSTTSQMNSAINQKANEITSSVSSTYTTKNEFNNLSIGGRNFLINTKTPKSYTLDTSTSTNNYLTKDPYMTYNHNQLSSYGFKVGDKITVSYDWKVTNVTTYGSFLTELVSYADNRYAYVGSFDNRKTVTSSETSGRIETTIALTENMLTSNVLRIRTDSAKWTFTISNVKLEKGNRATSWTPAPEDVDSAITNVDNKFDNYSTTNEMNSAITQKANEITSTVSSTYTTKNDFNNLTIGGSNLLKNTKTLDTVYGKGQNKWGVSDTGTEGFKKLEISTTNTDWVECQIPLYTEYNGLRQNVTISFQYYEGVSELLVFSFSAHKADGTRVKEIANTVVKTTFKDLGLRDGWSYVSYTFDPTSVNFQSGADHYRVQFKKINGKTGTISIRKIKLEHGNKATDWSPAPKDIDNAITTVNNKFDNYSTTTEMNSAITQKAGEITSSVSSTYTTKTDFNNLSIGGRNLAQKTSNEFSNPYTSFDGGTNKCSSIGKVLTDGLSVGDKITVRLIYEYTDIVPATGQTAKCRIQGSGDVTSWNAGSFGGSSNLTISGSGTHEFLYSFTIGSDHLKNSYWDVNIRHDYVQSGSVRWKMFKVEKGNKATDWSPAPEDMEDYTNTIANNLNNTFNSNINSSINKAKTDTLNEVADKYVTNKDYEEFKTTTSSSIEQTSNDVIIKFNTTTQNIQSVGGELAQFKESVQTNIRLHEDGISIGKTDNPFSVDITNQKMSFKDQGTEVAYISNQEMRITDAIIGNALTLGNFKFIPRLTGNVSLIWDDMGNMCYYDTSYCNMTNDSYPTANVYFREKPVPGELYTIEICASLGPGLNYWGIYNTTGDVYVNGVEYWRFSAGTAKKSFIWRDSTTYEDGSVHTGDNTFMQIYAQPYIAEGRPASTVTYAKLFKGDALWKDNGNLLRFNNIFDYPTGTTNAGLQLIATRDDYYIYTEMYCYLETGVEYKFSCEVDGGEGNWGGSSSDDTVQAFLMNQDDPDAWIYKEINPTSTFTVDVSTRYWLRLDVNKNGCSHWFSNLWITKV